MHTKNKQYTLLTIVVAPEKFKDDIGLSCAQLNTRGEYPHFILGEHGNVNELFLSHIYPGNLGLTKQEYLTIEYLVRKNNDAVNFLIPDPREILRNWQQWWKIFSVLPVDILQRSYIVPYAEYFKVADILPALDELAYRPTVSSSVQSLPLIGTPRSDGSVYWFNDRCKQASRDFNADGSIKPIL